MLGKITAVAAASLTIGTLALPGAVFAHSNHIRVVVRAGCTLGVNLEAHDYPAEPVGASASVTVEYDGQVTFQKVFGPAVKASAPNPDQTVPHLVRVTFDRFDYVGPDGDKTYGPFTIPACDVPQGVTTTTTAAPTTTTATPACVLGPDGHWNFAGTDIPCEGFTPTTTTVAPATDVPPVPTTTVAAFVCAGVMVADVCVVPTTTAAPPSSPLPVTGNKTDIELAIALTALAIGWCMLRIRRSRA